MEKTFLITWVTHNSRISERMSDLKIETGMPIILSLNDQIEITRYICDIVCEDNLKVLAYAICLDHVHIVLVCEKEEMSSIVNKLKSQSSRLFNINHRNTVPGQGGMPPCLSTGNRGKTQTKLWAQKFNRRLLDNEDKYHNAIFYVKNNREKHGLPGSKELEKLVSKIEDSGYNDLRSL